jgi:hypothetical protein
LACRHTGNRAIAHLSPTNRLLLVDPATGIVVAEVTD